MNKIIVTSDSKILTTFDNKLFVSKNKKEVLKMAKFQFRILTGATEAACKAMYDSLINSETHLHDPYTFYLFDKGGVGYLGDTPLFGGDASKFNMISSNITADILKPNSFYFVTADCTITDGQATPVTHTAKTGSIWVTNASSIPQELSLSIFTTYMTKYVLENTIHSDNASLDKNFTGTDTDLMTSGAVSTFVNAVVNSQAILSISFFKAAKSVTLTAADITAGKVTFNTDEEDPDTHDPITATATISANDHEGDIGLVFFCQTGAEDDDGNDEWVFVNLHGLINLYSGSTSDTTVTTVVNDSADSTGHTKQIRVEVNQSEKTASEFEQMVLDAIAAVDGPDASSYDPTDANGDNLSPNKFISESQLAGILVSTLNHFAQVIWGGGEGMESGGEGMKEGENN